MPTIVTPSTSRAAPIDRPNALKIAQYGGNDPGAVAQGDTVNWSYTVPALKKFDGNASLWIINKGAALLGEAYALIDYTISGGSALTLHRKSIPTGAANREASEGGIPVVGALPGDRIRGRDANLVGGAGDVSIREGLIGLEYDA